LPWDYSKKLLDKPQVQPRFERPADCKYKAVFEDLNDWKVVKVIVSEKSAPGEVEPIRVNMFGDMEAESARTLEKGRHGAYADGEGKYHVVKWTSLPFNLKRDTPGFTKSNKRGVQGKGIQGMQPGVILPKGNLVVRGQFWEPVHRAKGWFTPPSKDKERHVFRVKYILSTDIVLQEAEAVPALPKGFPRKSKTDLIKKGGRCVSRESEDNLKEILFRRALLDYEETPMHMKIVPTKLQNFKQRVKEADVDSDSEEDSLGPKNDDDESMHSNSESENEDGD
jgi:hypothetical protein